MAHPNPTMAHEEQDSPRLQNSVLGMLHLVTSAIADAQGRGATSPGIMMSDERLQTDMELLVTQCRLASQTLQHASRTASRSP